MSVVTVPYSMEVPKEGKEVVDSLTSIYEHFASGGSLEEAAALLPGVMQAVEGVKTVVEEIKSDYNDEMAGYVVHKVWGALKTSKPE